MTAKNSKISSNKEVLVDDISEEQSNNNAEIDQEKLAALKAKMAKKNEGEAVTAEVKKRSIRIGVIGSGQAGSRCAESMFKLGYPAVAINTASQDLEHIKIPEDNKLLLNYSLGGSSKELEIGLQAAETYKDEIDKLINKKLSDVNMFIFATSLGGGSGAGSAPVIINLLQQTNIPTLVMAILPMSNEDAQTKNNALQTLSKLAEFTKNGQISGLIVCDNAKLETIYQDVGQLDFYNVANDAMVEPIDVFNTLSSQPSPSKSLDPMELSKILVDGRGLITYGSMKVPNYTDDTSIAEAVIDNLNSNLLSSGFNLKEARYVGVMLAAPEFVWKQVKSSTINYAFAVINELCASPLGVFRGVYTTDSTENVVRVYSIFSGLSLPTDRVEQLKRETKELSAKSKQKDEERNINLKLDTGTNEDLSAADKVKQRIESKKSAFGKMLQQGIIDRRK